MNPPHPPIHLHCGHHEAPPSSCLSSNSHRDPELSATGNQKINEWTKRHFVKMCLKFSIRTGRLTQKKRGRATEPPEPIGTTPSEINSSGLKLSLKQGTRHSDQRLKLASSFTSFLRRLELRHAL